MLTFLAVAVPLVVLVAVLLCAVPPCPARVVWRRGRARPATPPDQVPTTARPLEDAALRAALEGPPAADDTCDRCAVSAAAAVYLPGGRLLLCGHHGRQHQAVLRTRGAVIVGELAFPGRSTTPA